MKLYQKCNYDSKAVANYFIDRAVDDNIPLTAMKLQKLIYYAHGWSLAIHNKPLINEQVKAKNYGLVIDTIYQEFKHFGNKPITTSATVIVFDDIDECSYVTTIPRIQNIDIEIKSLLDKIWDIYGEYSAVQLSNDSHKPGTPWAHTWGDNGVPIGTDITQDKIKAFFVEMAIKNKQL